MSFIKKPSEVTVKQTMSALIYGQPGLGKSTLACSAPGAVLFDFDGGFRRINGAHRIPTVETTSWEDVRQAFDEVKEEPSYSTIVIDTVGKMLFIMEEYIKRTNPKTKQADGSLSLKGYGMRKQMFINFIKECSMMGKNVIFVAHEIEQKRGDETIIRPEVGGSSANDLIKELDLVGYMEMYGDQRTISFTPCQKYYAKNACNLPGVIKVPTVVDDNGVAIGENNFFSSILERFLKQLATDSETTARFEALTGEMRSRGSEISDAASANAFVEWVKDLEHIYNSKAVALKVLQRAVERLGLAYDKTSRSYADRAAEAV